jgi:UDP-N-acetylmuramate dehydrogenase
MVLYKNFPLKELTTIKIGGEAKYFFEPEDVKQIKEYLPKLFKNEKIFFLGGGSNTVFGNFSGAIISIRKLKGLKVVRETERGIFIETLAGTPIKELIAFSIKHNLSGLEKLAGIPRITVGGAVAMNAGAYGFEISQIVENVYFIEPSTGELMECKEPNFGYRKSVFPNKGLIYKIVLKLEKVNYNIKTEVSKYIKKRFRNQPLNFPTAGSTFKNPKGDYAGRLLEEVGLKGFCTKNGLCFSEKHANFLVNTEKRATFEDVEYLINLAKEEVLENFNTNLEEEIKLVAY